ncbi:MAG: hypothetical protein ACYDH9_19910 [Limisphaerales bacterium]
MKTRGHAGNRNLGGYALMLVLIFVGISLLMLGNALTWTSTTATLTQRNNQYYGAASAAEAATEKVLARMSYDYQTQGQSLVAANLAVYQGLVPSASEDGFWSSYQFSDAQGNNSQTYVNKIFDWAYTPLQSQYSGLYGLAATYRIVSNAQAMNTSYSNIVAGVKQEVQVASIPVFQFAIFYSMDLEINPGANMNVTGRVHSNANLYAQPNGVGLTFQSHVTAVQQIVQGKKPGDPVSRSAGTVAFQAAHDAAVSSLTLPIGTNNSPAAVHAVIEVPPASEDPNSTMGKQRYYNKADLIILVSNNVVVATSGNWDSFNTPIPPQDVTNFVSTNLAFFDKRENKTVQTTQIDVGRLTQWSQTNTALRSRLGRDVRSVFVADQRSQTSSTEPGVRIVNGQTLPSLGLTVATPDPLYVQGNYNAPSAFLGTTNTTTTLPASLVADSINVLSTSWSDANSTKSVANRTAGNTTVNAAFISGNVPTGSGYYSGGVENYPRFLENWGGKTLTYNGSMVVMFYSQIATAPWGGSDVYSPPSRNWAFDLNFMDASKLPPGTPELRAIVRGNWSIIAPGSTL